MEDTNPQPATTRTLDLSGFTFDEVANLPDTVFGDALRRFLQPDDPDEDVVSAFGSAT